MSIGLLTDPEKQHDILDDFEASFWSLLYGASHYYALTGARTATAVRTPFARFSAVYAPFSQPPDLTLDRLRREGCLHVFTSWKRIATRAGGLYRRGYPIPPPSNTRQPFRITLSRPSAFSIAFPRA